jgi:beta-lactamase regulating signal transducer with metallopeptidase domain
MNELLAMRVAALGSVLLHFLWQGALIGLLAWLTLLLARREKPQVRYALACLALLSCLLLPTWQVARLFLAETAAVSDHSSMGAAGPEDRAEAPAASAAAAAFLPVPALPSPPDHLLRWIVGLWALGAGLLAARLACGLLWVERLRASATVEDSTVADPERWQATVDRLALRFGLRRAVALRFIAEGDSPLSAGWLKPVVLLPAALALRMPYPLLEALLAHELAHIRRHDYLVNLLQAAVEVVLFYHPVVWWLSRRIREEREQVADALAADVLGERRRLALALAELDAFHSPVPALAQAAQGGHLMRRIQQLVRPRHRNLGAGVVLPLFVLTLAGLAFYATAEPRSAAEAAEDKDGVEVHGNLHIGRHGKVSNEAYALVRRDRERFTISGDLEDVGAIRAARRKIDGDFLWFRRGKEAFIVRDAALLARAEAAWQPTEELDQSMQALDEQMEPHQQKMDELSDRMDRLTPSEEEDAGIDEASQAIESLAEQQEDLAIEQLSLSRELRRAEGDTQRQKLEKQMEALSQKQEALGRQMDEKSKALEALTDRIEVRHRPMDELAREMEIASEPMEELGKQMELLGKEIEQKAKAADKEIWSLIEEASRKGLATSAKEIR